MAAAQIQWTLRALEDSPRLQIISTPKGTYEVRSTDDVLLYRMVDARYLHVSDPWHTTEQKFWRCFLRTPRGDSVVEVRRHEVESSDIGIYLTHHGQLIKTGLVCLANRYGHCSYTLKWKEWTFVFVTTRQAPNSSAADTGSILCTDSKGTQMAWLTRRSSGAGYTAENICAMIWFESAGIAADLIEVIISSLMAITDVQFPHEPDVS